MAQYRLRALIPRLFPAILVISAILLVLKISSPHPFYRLSFEEQKSYAAHSIAATLEKNEAQLSDEKRGHFRVRLYRLSGDSKHRPQIESYAEGLVSAFKLHVKQLNSPEYIKLTAEHFLKLSEKAPLKHRYRTKARRLMPEMVFVHRLLFLAFQIKSFGLIDANHVSQAEWNQAMAYLKKQPYRDYLLNDDIIRYNTTRAVNMLFQLKFLGLENHYEEDFKEKFKKLFFDRPDASLDRILYLNKIYGLTHWLIAASHFYQQPISKEKSQWILDYFSQNLEMILIRNTPDTAAEVAICFKLAGQGEQPPVVRIQKYLLEKFDPQKGIIPSDKKKTGMNDIEHRNIVAYMALTPWQQLHPGPDVGASQLSS